METTGEQPGTLVSGLLRRILCRRPASGLCHACYAGMVCLAFLWLNPPALAQHPPNAGGNPPSADFPSDGTPLGGASSPDSLQGLVVDPFEALNAAVSNMPLLPVDTSRLVNDESCNTWTRAAVNSPTVSVVRLQVPERASGEFQKACGAFRGRRFEQAERHARKAIQIYPKYAAAWVLLGQTLNSEDQADAARSACEQAREADPRYAPPYICLADFAARAKDWKQAADLSSRALSLDPATDEYAFFYAANADFHLRRLADAELYARSAEKLDTWHRLPQVHMLLAQVYEEQGNSQAAAEQLRKYLKRAPKGQGQQIAKEALARIEAAPAK